MPTRTLASLALLLALCQAAAAAKTSDEERIAFAVPGAPWTLTLPKGGFAVERRQLKPDGRSGYFLLSDEKNMLTVSFFIEPVKDCENAGACRDMVWKLGNPSWENPQKVVQSEIGEASCFEFFMPSFRGVPVKQQNLYAEFVKDGFWVDMHLSKVSYEPREHELFERVVKSVRFEPKDAKSRKQG